MAGCLAETMENHVGRSTHMMGGPSFHVARPAWSFDDLNVLHNEAGPAMAFADGFAIHAWHGTRVPFSWIEDTDALNPKDVLQTKNVEQRAAGFSILTQKSPHKLTDLAHVLDGDPQTDIGALVQFDIGLEEPGRYLMAQCPRNGTIILGVPRQSDIDGSVIATVIAAQAYVHGLTQNEYIPPEVRT